MLLYMALHTSTQKTLSKIHGDEKNLHMEKTLYTLHTSRRYNPAFNAYQNLYKTNELSFMGEYAIKNSGEVTEILMPTNTMRNRKNPNREYQWERYLTGASYSGYPSRYLQKILGLTLKGMPSYNFTGIEDLFYYATVNDTNILEIQSDILAAIVKFGSGILRAKIIDGVNIATSLPKLEVIPMNNVLDAKIKFNPVKNIDEAEFIVYKEDTNIFNEKTKSYEGKIILVILGLDEEGEYYEATLLEEQYGDFDFKHPANSKYLTLSYPTWNSAIDFIPVIFFNQNGLRCSWCESYIQPLIDLTWQMFSLGADLRFALHQQSTAHLAIYGTDPDADPKSFATGLGAVHLFSKADAKEEYIAPSVAGIQLQQEKYETMKDEAENFMINLLDSSANSSGEALALKISDKTNSLIAVVKNVGNAIQRMAEMICEITGKGNPDEIEYIPNVDFTHTEEISTIDESMRNNEENL